MKKAAYLLLIPLFSFTLSSCSKGFEMIDEGEHGNTYSGGSSSQPSTIEKLETFIDNAYLKLDSDEFKQYASKGSNVYLETQEQANGKTNKKYRTSLAKNNISLTSQIVEKGNETKKTIIYADASDANKIKLSFDSYINDEVKHYSSEETKENGRYQHLISYYETSIMSYLDNMSYMLANFDMTYNHACDFAEKNEAPESIVVFEGQASIKQNKETILYNFYQFDFQHDKLNAKGEIYYTGDYDIKKLVIKYDDKTEGIYSKAYMSLLPYDKNIDDLSNKGRESISPNKVEEIIE